MRLWSDEKQLQFSYYLETYKVWHKLALHTLSIHWTTWVTGHHTIDNVIEPVPGIEFLVIAFNNCSLQQIIFFLLFTLQGPSPFFQP